LVNYNYMHIVDNDGLKFERLRDRKNVECGGKH
jgi:hypothetical protein